jgi:excisionase family DNA binding protein
MRVMIPLCQAMNMINPERETTYNSVDELATELGLSRQSVYTGLRNGRIPSIRLGKRFVIPRAAISAWLRSAGGAVPPPAN